jgi:hypothetical protein
MELLPVPTCISLMKQGRAGFEAFVLLERQRYYPGGDLAGA